MKKKLGIGFLIIAGILVAVSFGFTSKIYPVATVNNGFISMRLFQTAQRAAEVYYGRQFALYEGFASTTEVEFTSGMRQVALQSLIEDQLITDELLKTYEAQSLSDVVDAQIATALASSSQITAEVVNVLFGVTVAEFTEVILAPEARAELLRAELVKAGIDFDAWLELSLREANITIAVADLEWGGQRVELTGEQSYTAKVKGIFDQIASTTKALQAESEAGVAASSSAQE